jgi:hypothetical protein
MAYKLKYSDNSKGFINIDQLGKDETTDLIFYGKDHVDYGEVLWNDFLHLMENFCNAVEPLRPIEGQLWYDNGTNILKIRKAKLPKPTQTADAETNTGKLVPDLSALQDKLNAIKNEKPKGDLVISGSVKSGDTITLTDTINLANNPNGVNNPIITWYLQ